MKKVLNILRIISIIVILILAALVFVPNVLGITPTIDLLGTMKPEISKGSISYVNREYKYSNIKENDIIQIKMYNQDIMVRVKSKNNKDKTLTVQGDAESKQSVKVISKKEYIGKHIFSIPKVGFLVLFLQRFFFLTIILIVIIVISLIVDITDYKNESKTQKIVIKEKENKKEKEIDKSTEIEDESDKEQEKLEKELEILKQENNKKNKDNDIKKESKKNKKDNIEILDEDEINEINKILDLKKEEPEILEIEDDNNK